METTNTLIQNAQNLHHKLALIYSAVVGLLETHCNRNELEDVYTIEIYEQLGANVKLAGSLAEQLSEMNKWEVPVKIGCQCQTGGKPGRTDFRNEQTGSSSKPNI